MYKNWVENNRHFFLKFPLFYLEEIQSRNFKKKSVILYPIFNLVNDRVLRYSDIRLDYLLVYSTRLDYFNNRMVFDIENIDI